MSASVASTKGHRESMEDRHLVILDFEESCLHFDSTSVQTTKPKHKNNNSPQMQIQLQHSKTCNNRNSTLEKERPVEFSEEKPHEFTIGEENKEKASTEEKESLAFFAVFDGHAGSEASQFCEENFLETLKNKLEETKAKLEQKKKESEQEILEEEEEENVRLALRETFLLVDKNFEKFVNESTKEFYCGTTACTLLIMNQKMYASNLGDSRLVLCRNGTNFPLSQDHKPHSPEEKERIERAGGWVTTERELNLSNLFLLNPNLLQEKSIPKKIAETIGYTFSHRLNGELSVSRGIGDLEVLIFFFLIIFSFPIQTKKLTKKKVQRRVEE